jgi:hypothetical protein
MNESAQFVDVCKNPHEYLEHDRDSPYVHIYSSVRRKSLCAILLSGVNSDKNYLPSHAIKLVNATSAK